MKDFATIRKIAGRQVVILTEVTEADGFRVLIKFILKNGVNVGMNMSFTDEKGVDAAFKKLKAGKSDEAIAQQIKQIETDIQVEPA